MLRCFISDLLFLSSFRKSVVRLRLASRKTFSWGISVFTMTLNLLFVISTERSNSSFKFSQGCSGISFNHLSIGMASKETNENHYKPLEYLLRIVLIMDELMSLPFNASLLGWGKISSKYLMILSYSGELYMPDSLQLPSLRVGDFFMPSYRSSKSEQREIVQRFKFGSSKRL